MIGWDYNKCKHSCLGAELLADKIGNLSDDAISNTFVSEPPGHMRLIKLKVIDVKNDVDRLMLLSSAPRGILDSAVQRGLSLKQHFGWRTLRQGHFPHHFGPYRDLKVDLYNNYQEVMHHNNNTHISTYCMEALYRITYAENDTDLEPDGPFFDPSIEPELEWWEEVDRVYPLDDPTEVMASSDFGRDPVDETADLEREGDAVFEDAERDIGASAESGADTDASKKGKKKRQRSASARNASKKSKQNGNGNGNGKGDSKAPPPRKKPQAQTQRQKQQQQQRVQSPATTRSRERLNNRGDGTAATETGDLNASRGRERHRTERTTATAARAAASASGLLKAPQFVPGSQPPPPTSAFVAAELARPPSPFLTPATPATPITLRPSVLSGPAMQSETTTVALMSQGGEDVTSQGLERERHRRMLEMYNPVPELPAKKKEKERTPDDCTFEITNLDWSPLEEDFLAPAEMLAKERRIADKERKRRGLRVMRFDSKKLNSGDWIVLAKNEETKEWLASFFATESFSARFRATLVSDQSEYVKYALKVGIYDSKVDSKVLLDHLFEDIYDLGYWRVINETRNYKDKDGEINKAYHKALKKRIDFDDKGTPYVKTIWLRFSPETEKAILDNWEDLNFWYGVNEMELEKVKDKKKGKQASEQPGEQRSSAANQNVNMELSSEDELNTAATEKEGTVNTGSRDDVQIGE